MTELIRRLNGMSWFKFVSSIRLAVPLMLIVIVAVAAGTIFESLYSADYAKLAVYSTHWFFALMILLWMNIFAAMMSRYPWKKHHLGFVLTHIGMLTLMIGAFVTGYYGIDGSLQIPEKQANSTIILPKLRLGYQLAGSPSLQGVSFDRTISEMSGSDLDYINDKLRHIVIAEKFIPFAQIERGFSASSDPSGPVAMSFILKSQFFNVSEWLHSIENPEMQMGPATLRLVIDQSQTREPVPAPARKVAKAQKSPGQGSVKISDAKSKALLKIADLETLKKSGVVVDGVKVEVKTVFRRATVAENKIVESPDNSGPPNPALELSLSKGGETQREIVYAKFPDFSLNKKGNFGLSFSFVANDADMIESEPDAEGAEGLPSGHPVVGGGRLMDGGNTIEFHINRSKPDEVRVELHKGGKKIQEAVLKEGESLQTPWMGITVFIGSLIMGGQPVTKVIPLKPEPGNNLPPSALLVRPAGSQESFWIGQGEVKSIQVEGRQISLVYANQTLNLPFELRLEKFTKTDYPGTETPMAYESLVEVTGEGKMHVISMNEPLKKDGYTLYQASFVLNQGQPPITILSVNWDPGRPIKYAGSVILAFGIVIFTVMRSRMARAKKGT